MLVIVSAGLNVRTANGRIATQISLYADRILDHLDGRTWLISDGAIDHILALKAHQRGMDLRILNPFKGGSSAYREYIAGKFENPRLQGLARVGFASLMEEWFNISPEVIDEVSVLSSPDSWVRSGLNPVPHYGAYQGTRDPESVDPAALFDQFNAFWSESDAWLSESDDQKSLILAWNGWKRRHMSKMANNVGVFLEDRDRRDLAYRAYERALLFDIDNLSALLNQLNVCLLDDRPEKEALNAELNGILDDKRPRTDIWYLSTYYGYVRRPEAFARRGIAWALSGKPNVAIDEIRRAMKLARNPENLQLTLASIYLDQQDTESSEAELLALLKKNPRNGPTLLGLMRIAVRRGDFASAQSYLDRLEELGASLAAVRFEAATLKLSMGDSDAAKEILIDLVTDQSDNTRAWTVLALVDLQDGGDNEWIDKALRKIATSNVVNPGIFFVIANIQLQLGREEQAYHNLERVIKLQPSNIPALELLLRLDLRKARRDLIKKHAERLMHIDTKNALANMILGELQRAKGHYALAESYYQVSIDREPSAPALINLAWCVQLRGDYDTALGYALKAVESNDESSDAWHTLGLIYLKLDRISEAQKSLERALELYPKNLIAQTYTAMLYEKQGKLREANDVIDEVVLHPARVPDWIMDMAREVKASVRHAGE